MIFFLVCVHVFIYCTNDDGDDDVNDDANQKLKSQNVIY